MCSWHSTNIIITITIITATAVTDQSSWCRIVATIIIIITTTTTTATTAIEAVQLVPIKGDPKARALGSFDSSESMSAQVQSSTKLCRVFSFAARCR
jgi:hypothetical protein